MYKRIKKQWLLFLVFIMLMTGAIYGVVTSISLVEKPVDNSVESVDNFSITEDTSDLPVVAPVTAEKPSEQVLQEYPISSLPEESEEVTEEPRKSYYTYTEEELDLLSRLIEAEGGCESYDTMLKIGSVVMNRVSDTGYFPNTIREVIYQKNQFSVTFIKIKGVTMIDRPASDLAKQVALEILEYGSVLPLDVQVFFEKSITSGWVGSRAKYGTFDSTTFAYIYPAK